MYKIKQKIILMVTDNTSQYKLKKLTYMYT